MERSGASSDAYPVQFVKHQQPGDGGVEYNIRVTTPGNYVVHIKDRYSSMRSFQSQIKKQFNLATFNGLPTFPPKKAFGSKTNEFLNARSSSLQQFFNSFFSNKDVLRQADHLIQIYLQQHAADEQSKQKIKEYMDWRENKNNQNAQKKPALGGGAAALIDTSKPVNMVIGGGASGQAPSLGQDQQRVNPMEVSTSASG